MKSIKSFCILLCVSVFTTALSPVQAAQSSINHHQMTYIQPFEIQKNIKTEKKGIVKRWLEKRLMKKMQAVTEGDGITSSAKTGLLFGIISFALLILGVFLISASGGLAVAVLLSAGVSAIVGDIFSIKTRRNIRKSQNPEQYRKEKNMATWGLALSLLTGLIPLGLLIYFLLTLG